MVDGCMSEMGEVVERFGGIVDKVIGDALMAVFGAPVAHEDDAERAVADGIGDPAPRVRAGRADFGGLCVRVGVNTGEVIFAPVGPRPAGVHGDGRRGQHRRQAAGRRSARGCAARRGDPRRLRAGDRLRGGGADPRQGQGGAAARVARSGVTSAPADRPLSAAPFIGRDAELELLVRAWARTSGELHPQLVTLVGPPGIGKTRLTREFAARVEADGGRTLRGRPLPYGEPAAYWAFGRSSGRRAGSSRPTRPTSRPASSTSARPRCCRPRRRSELARHLSILARSTEDTVEDRQALFASAQRFLEALAREQPTLVVLEDLHWADDSLRGAHRGALGAPRWECRCCCSRSPGPSSSTRDRIGRDCRPMSPSSFRRSPIPARTSWCVNCSPARRIGEAVARRVEEAAGGNPLFIEELAAWLVGGRAPRAPAGSRRTSRRSSPRGSISCPPPERQVILDASVVGDFFWLGSLQALGGNGSLAGTLQLARAPRT